MAPASDGETTSPRPFDHVEAAAAAPIPAGVYRVVGRPDGEVTLLRPTVEGRRRATGHLERVPLDIYRDLAPASDPDAGIAPLRGLRSLLDGLYHQLRP